MIHWDMKTMKIWYKSLKQVAVDQCFYWIRNTSLEDLFNLLIIDFDVYLNFIKAIFILNIST